MNSAIKFSKALSIPLQQIAYTIVNDGNISDEQYQKLGKIMDVDQIEEIYQPTVSDPVKINVREREGD